MPSTDAIMLNLITEMGKNRAAIEKNTAILNKPKDVVGDTLTGAKEDFQVTVITRAIAPVLKLVDVISKMFALIVMPIANLLLPVLIPIIWILSPIIRIMSIALRPVMTSLMELLPGLKNVINNPSAIGKFVGDALTMVLGQASGIIGNLASAFLPGLITAVEDIGSVVWNIITQQGPKWISGIAGWLQEYVVPALGNLLGWFTSTALPFLHDQFDGLLTWLEAQFPGAADTLKGIQSFVDATWNWVQTNILNQTDPIGSMIAKITAIGGELTDGITSLGHIIIDEIESMLIGPALVALGGFITTITSQFLGPLLTNAGKFINDVQKGLIAFVGDIGNNFLNPVWQIIQGLNEGLLNAISGIMDMIAAVETGINTLLSPQHQMAVLNTSTVDALAKASTKPFTNVDITGTLAAISGATTGNDLKTLGAILTGDTTGSNLQKTGNDMINQSNKDLGLSVDALNRSIANMAANGIPVNVMVTLSNKNQLGIASGYLSLHGAVAAGGDGGLHTYPGGSTT